MKLTRATLALGASLAVVATAGAAPALPPGLVQLGSVTGRVFRVSVQLETTPPTIWTEVVAPASSHCRRELPESVTIAGGRTWALTEAQGTTVRTGSRAFLAGLARACRSLTPLARRLASGEPTGVGTEVRFTWAQVGGTARVEEELTADAARSGGVFAVPLDMVASWALERRLGARPWQPIRGYWAGRRAGAWRATMSVEAYYAERGVALLDVYYSRGSGARRRELELISEPRAQAAESLAELRALGRQHGWPSYVLRLANGERATVYTNLSEGRSPVTGFTIVTARTALTVSGGFRLRDIAPFARRLRSLGR